MTEVKDSCILFRQKAVPIEVKIKNLETLITSQLEFCALANMDDLGDAIVKFDQLGSRLDANPVADTTQTSISTNKKAKKTKNQKTTNKNENVQPETESEKDETDRQVRTSA